MMPCDYIAKSGAKVAFDLDAVTDIAAGYSNYRPGWTATLIYVPEQNVFVELRSSPPDIRGNSAEEAAEVEPPYIDHTFSISEDDLALIRRHPAKWQFVNRRPSA